MLQVERFFEKSSHILSACIQCFGKPLILDLFECNRFTKLRVITLILLFSGIFPLFYHCVTT